MAYRKSDDGLTDQQRMFVHEYIVDLNSKQAAIRSGYSPRSAEQQGSRLLSHAKVQKAIKTAQDGLQKATGVTQSRVVNELAKIAFDNVVDPDSKMAYRDQHKMKALELLGKHLGMWHENLRVDMTVKTFEQQLDEIEDADTFEPNHNDPEDVYERELEKERERWK